MARTVVVCALLSPWPLHLLERQHPGLPTAVLDESSRRVVHANDLARTAGVSAGQRESSALSRCPELHAEVVSGPTATAAWSELLETLYARSSDRVEGRTPGVVFLQAPVSAAREIAAALHARVGVAASLEVAQLAALRARPGEVRELPADTEKTYLPLSLTAHLQVLGLTAEHVARLEFLGVRGLADLMKWSAAQRAAFLGVDVGKRINRFLKGERTLSVARYVPSRTLERSLPFDQALQEPGEVEAALRELTPPLFEELRGRTAAYLTVHGDTLGGRLSSTRKLKWPVQAAGIGRLALRMLLDQGVLALGLDVLTLSCSGLQQPARQVGLWPGPGELDAVQEVLDRYPSALVRVEWRQRHALVSDAQYVWVDWLTGAERSRPMDPRRLPEDVATSPPAASVPAPVPLFGASDR